MFPKKLPYKFSLTEVVAMLSLLGLLCIVTIPSYQSYRVHSRAAALAGSFREYASAFKSYSAEHEALPSDEIPGKSPSGMEKHLPKFSAGSILGGEWDWNPHAGRRHGAVCLVNPNPHTEVIEHMDTILDDGNLATGALVFNGTRIIFFLDH